MHPVTGALCRRSLVAAGRQAPGTPVANCAACFLTDMWPSLHVQQLVQRALGGESDRSLKFGKGQGMWLVSPVISTVVKSTTPTAASFDMLCADWQAMSRCKCHSDLRPCSQWHAQ